MSPGPDPRVPDPRISDPRGGGPARPPRRVSIGVVIPTLNAAEGLPATLDCLQRAAAAGLVGDVVVVDGGSVDDTIAIARHAGVRVLVAPRGRGTQLAAGARAVKGGWLLFLHADTVLGEGWELAAADFLDAEGGWMRAGYFRFRLDAADEAARWLETAVAWRNRHLALPYGDQGLLISRVFYDQLGGFKPIPLMEDVEIVRRIGRARLRPLEASAITSGRRYADGYLLRVLRNLGCLALYAVGVPPRLIAKLYG